jgi:predicted small lipoprotein YifL
MATKDLALIRTLLAIAAAVALAACSLPGPYRPEAADRHPVDVPQQPDPGVTPAPTPAPTPPPSTTPSADLPPAPPAKEFRFGPATQSLVNQAHAQAARGELPAASTTLDRAIRIEPQNPLVWIELARLRLSESDPRQAESCARKALSLGSSSPSARVAAGRVLADALRAQHRDGEARDLESQPWMAN